MNPIVGYKSNRIHGMAVIDNSVDLCVWIGSSAFQDWLLPNGGRLSGRHGVDSISPVNVHVLTQTELCGCVKGGQIVRKPNINERKWASRDYSLRGAEQRHCEVESRVQFQDEIAIVAAGFLRLEFDWNSKEMSRSKKDKISSSKCLIHSRALHNPLGCWHHVSQEIWILHCVQSGVELELNGCFRYEICFRNENAVLQVLEEKAKYERRWWRFLDVCNVSYLFSARLSGHMKFIGQ